MPAPVQGDDGVPFFTTKNPDWKPFVAKLNQLAAAVRSAMPRGGRGYTMRRTIGGTSYDITPGTGLGGARKHPFQVKTRAKPNAPNQYQASVEVYSFVVKDSNSPSNVAQLKVEGQNLTNLSGSTQKEPYWFDCLPTDLIWMEWRATDNSYSIRSIGMGDTWGDPTKIVERNPGGGQINYRIAIASTQEEEVPSIIQHLYTNLVEDVDCVFGISARTGIAYDIAPYIPAMP